MSPRLIVGDALASLRAMPSQSVHLCVTSPPYWGLRDYGVDGQLGLEKDPREYVARIVEIFEEVRRVLRHDGTLWLNMGDCHTDGGRGKDTGSTLLGSRRNQAESRRATNRQNGRPFGLGTKQLIGMPWRVALALQDAGWFLRSDIIWHKPNPMPESTRDRPTKAHEFLFLFARESRYYYDRHAISEPVSGTANARGKDGVGRKVKVPAGWDTRDGNHRDDKTGNYTGTRAERPHSRLRMKSNPSFLNAVRGLVARRNKRDVWTITPKAYKGAHFATYPPELVRPCILAGTSPRACELCGAPWLPVYGEPVEVEGRESGNKARKDRSDFGGPAGTHRRQAHAVPWKPTAVEVTGWERTCTCSLAVGSGRCVVLDPFAGAGTTGLVAEEEGRDSVLIELNPEYADLIRARLGLEAATA